METLITQLGLSVDISGYDASQQFIVVEDSILSSFGGTGTDILTNVEFIAFQDQYLPLAKEEFIDIDPNTGLEVRRFVNGTLLMILLVVVLVMMILLVMVVPIPLMLVLVETLLNLERK